MNGTSVAEYMQGAASVKLTWQGWLMHGQSFPITAKGLQVPTPKVVAEGARFEAVYTTREGKHIKALSAKCSVNDHGLAGAIIPELVKVFTSVESRHVREVVTSSKEGGASLNIDWKLSGTLALKSITAYREYKSGFVNDNDASPLSAQLGDGNLPFHSFAEELRLNGGKHVVKAADVRPRHALRAGPPGSGGGGWPNAHQAIEGAEGAQGRNREARRGAPCSRCRPRVRTGSAG